METPVNTGINQEIRDEKGRFVKGFSGNPAGKPKGVKHMTTILSEALTKVAEGSGDSEDITIVKALIKKAKAGDVTAIREIWDRMEGKAQQFIDHTTDGEPIVTKDVSQMTQEEIDEYLRLKLSSSS